MQTQKWIQSIKRLPPEAQAEVRDFVQRLQERYAHDQTAQAKTLEADESAFVGMWANREDMVDSEAWVRRLRAQHWEDTHG